MTNDTPTQVDTPNHDQPSTMRAYPDPFSWIGPVQYLPGFNEMWKAARAAPDWDAMWRAAIDEMRRTRALSVKCPQYALEGFLLSAEESERLTR